MAIQVAALVSALAPALKSLIAAEALNLMKKYLFDTRTKGARMVKASIYKELEKALAGMDDSEWGSVLKQLNGEKKSYKKKAGEWIGELLPSALGSAVNAGGSAYGAYTSILADVLGGALDGMTNSRQAAAWGNPYAAGAGIFGGGMAARGAALNALTSGVGGWLDNLSGQIRNENLQNRMTQMMLENRMTGEMLKQLRFAAGSGNFGKGQDGDSPGGIGVPKKPITPRGGGGGVIPGRYGRRRK